MEPLKQLSLVDAMLNAIPQAAESYKAAFCEGIFYFARTLLAECRNNHGSDPIIVQRIGELVSATRRFAETRDNSLLEGGHSAVKSLKGANGFGIRLR